MSILDNLFMPRRIAPIAPLSDVSFPLYRVNMGGPIFTPGIVPQVKMYDRAEIGDNLATIYYDDRAS